MKKTLTTIGLLSLTMGAFAQGTVLFKNSLGTGNITIGAGGQLATGNAAPGQYTVALLYNPATSGTVAQSQLTQVAMYTPSTASGDGPGYFTDPVTVTTPAGSGTAIFEVVAWTGNFANYAAAVAGNASYIGTTAEFINGMGNPNGTPATAATPLNGTGGSWDGNLVLSPNTVITPEPSTIALGGLGAAALLLFRRRK